MAAPKPTPTIPVDQGGCPVCGHPTIILQPSGNLYCPCEDCRPGGTVFRIVEVIKPADQRKPLKKAG